MRPQKAIRRQAAAARHPAATWSASTFASRRRRRSTMSSRMESRRRRLLPQPRLDGSPGCPCSRRRRRGSPRCPRSRRPCCISPPPCSAGSSRPTLLWRRPRPWPPRPPPRLRCPIGRRTCLRLLPCPPHSSRHSRLGCARWPAAARWRAAAPRPPAAAAPLVAAARAAAAASAPPHPVSTRRATTTTRPSRAPSARARCGRKFVRAALGIQAAGQAGQGSQPPAPLLPSLTGGLLFPLLPAPLLHCTCLADPSRAAARGGPGCAGRRGGARHQPQVGNVACGAACWRPLQRCRAGWLEPGWGLPPPVSTHASAPTHTQRRPLGCARAQGEGGRGANPGRPLGRPGVLCQVGALFVPALHLGAQGHVRPGARRGAGAGVLGCCCRPRADGRGGDAGGC